MRRVLFSWRSHKIYSYPFFLYLGIMCGLAAGIYAGALHGTDPSHLCLATLILLVPALVGSRLLFVLEHLALFLRSPHRVWARNEGGASLYGGLILAVALSLLLLPLLHLPFGQFWDAASITMLVGMVFTKIGCLLNGCCVGRETTSRFSQRLPDVHGVWLRRLPSQLLESGVALAVLLLAAVLWSRLPFHGAFFLITVGFYAIARWPLEGTREQVDQVGGVSINRVISGALALGSLAFFVALLPS